MGYSSRPAGAGIYGVIILLDLFLCPALSIMGYYGKQKAEDPS